MNHSQKLWLKARDEACAYTPDDGSEYKISQNACMHVSANIREKSRTKSNNHERSCQGGGQSMIKPKWNDYIKYHCEFMGKQFSDSGCKDRNQFLHSSQ